MATVRDLPSKISLFAHYFCQRKMFVWPTSVEFQFNSFHSRQQRKTNSQEFFIWLLATRTQFGRREEGGGTYFSFEDKKFTSILKYFKMEWHHRKKISCQRKKHKRQNLTWTNIVALSGSVPHTDRCFWKKQKCHRHGLIYQKTSFLTKM